MKTDTTTTNKTSKRALWVALPAIVGAGLLAGTFWSQTDAHAQGQDAPAVTVGTYDPQQVFEGYHARESFMQQMMQLEQQMQQAEDQQQMMQLQQQAQQIQNQAIEQFERDMQQAIPDVAQEHNVQIVAMGVVYTDDSVQEQSLTQPIIEQMNSNAGDAGQQPAQEPAPLPFN